VLTIEEFEIPSKVWWNEVLGGISSRRNGRVLSVCAYIFSSDHALDKRPMTFGVQNDAQWLDSYRSYLHLLARLELSPQYAAKVDLSGVVQQTLLEAHAAQDQMNQLDEQHRAAMLRQILANNMKDEIRKFSTAARDIAREQSLHVRIDQSSQRLENFLAAKQSSPSHVVSRNEQAARLANALATLPEHQRVAVELHHLRGMRLVEVAEQMDRTKGAVASLVARGIKKLRAELKNTEV
jgi:RNA polymerase sigma-70 factor (ECF subfamily)